jgi:hypothetical protein
MRPLRVRPFLFLGLAAAGCWNPPATPSTPKPHADGGPRLKAAQKRIDIGEVDDKSVVEQRFPLENVGDRPLHVAVVRRSCTCEDVTGPAEDIAPGGKGAVTFRWTPPLGAVGPTTVAAEVETNDPKEPMLRLELTGRVAPRIRTHPVGGFIDFDNVGNTETGERTLKVFSATLADFDLAAKLTGDGFELAKTPLPAGEFIEGAVVKSGYRLTLKTTPKLPPGYYRAELTLTVKPPNEDAKTTVLPVYALRDNRPFRVTPGQVEFDRPLGVEDQTKKIRLQMLNPSDKDSVELARIEPSFLQVSKPTSLGGGTWQFQVTLPKDAEEAKKYSLDGFFEGQIVLKTAEGETAVRVKWELPEKK